MFSWLFSSPVAEPEEIRPKSKPTHSVQSSSYMSLTSRSSIKQNTLPGYLRFSNETPLISQVARSLPIYDRSKPQTARTSRLSCYDITEIAGDSPDFNRASRTTAGPMHKNRSSTRVSSRNITIISDTADLNTSERSHATEVVLKLSSIELTNYDISTFNLGRDFSINIVDAYFSILRSRQRKALLKNPEIKRVLMLNYKLTSAVFDQRASEAVCSRRNVFKYE